MKSLKTIKAKYKIICSQESLNGNQVLMYGVEGRCGSQKMVLSSLSCDRKRIELLVKRLNEGEFELCLLKDVVNDFLYETYGVAISYFE